MSNCVIAARRYGFVDPERKAAGIEPPTALPTKHKPQSGVSSTGRKSR
jgi:hypothetical protein